jgi:hypothetical protein
MLMTVSEINLHVGGEKKYSEITIVKELKIIKQ